MGEGQHGLPCVAAPLGNRPLPRRSDGRPCVFSDQPCLDRHPTTTPLLTPIETPQARAKEVLKELAALEDSLQPLLLRYGKEKVIARFGRAWLSCMAAGCPSCPARGLGCVLPPLTSPHPLTCYGPLP